MWKKRSRPTPEEIAPRDDIDEARSILAETKTGLNDVKRQWGFVDKITSGMIDRQGRNHYMELLYEHVPGRAQ